MFKVLDHFVYSVVSSFLSSYCLFNEESIAEVLSKFENFNKVWSQALVGSPDRLDNHIPYNELLQAFLTLSNKKNKKIYTLKMNTRN